MRQGVLVVSFGTKGNKPMKETQDQKHQSLTKRCMYSLVAALAFTAVQVGIYMIVINVGTP